MCIDVCIMCREFSAVEIDAYNRLNGIEPTIVPDEVIFVAVLCSEFALYIQYYTCVKLLTFWLF